LADFLFEKDHKPHGSFPYIQFSNKNLTYISHYHEEIEIAYVSEGKICGYAASREIPLSKGDICIFMPGEIHNFISAEDNNIYIFKIRTRTYIENINFEKIRLSNNKITCRDNCYKDILDIIQKIHSEYERKEKGYEFSIRALKNNLISYILRKLDYKIIDTHQNIHLLNNVNAYLEKNFIEKITLEDISENCHMSKYYFSHTFKKLTGMSFMAYLTLFRIEKATVLLQVTNKSMSDIAYESGFGNVRSFNRSFKETLSLTPVQYRKLHKETAAK